MHDCEPSLFLPCYSYSRTPCPPCPPKRWTRLGRCCRSSFLYPVLMATEAVRGSWATLEEILSVQSSHQAVRAVSAERQTVSGLIQPHPVKGFVTEMESDWMLGGQIQGPAHGGTCLGELATGFLLGTIVISLIIQFIPSTVQGLWKSQNHVCKQVIFLSIS